MQSESYLQVLERELRARVARNPRYSIRAFARDLGISPASLSQILRGIQIPSVRIADRIVRTLGLSDHEAAEFRRSIVPAGGRPESRATTSLVLFRDLPVGAISVESLRAHIERWFEDLASGSGVISPETETRRVEIRVGFRRLNRPEDSQAR